LEIITASIANLHRQTCVFSSKCIIDADAIRMKVSAFQIYCLQQLLALVLSVVESHEKGTPKTSDSLCFFLNFTLTLQTGLKSIPSENWP